MATGYERGKIYPQPVRRLSHAFIQQWAMANNNSISLQAERQPDVLVVKLLPRKKFEFNNQIYAYSQLLSVLANITDVQQKLIKVQSAWQTRSDAGTIFKIIKDAGFNAKIDFKFGQGGKDEQSFMDEWQNIMKGADQKSP